MSNCRSVCRDEPSVPHSPFVPFTLSTIDYFSSGWPVAYLIATVIFGIGLLIGSHVQCPSLKQVARQSSVPSRMDA